MKTKSHSRFQQAVALVAASSILFASSAGAQATNDQAKTYFNAGAQAYTIGEFAAAIQAFDAAYKIAPKPAILFSLAQAERRQYFVDHKTDHLQKAIDGFHKYLDEVKQGGRRVDATQALEELEPIYAEMKKEGKMTAPPPPEAAAKLPPRLMVTSPTPGAQVSVDGGKMSDAPYVSEVKTGKHSVRVEAKGFDPESRDIQALDGGLVALDLDLKERPAYLSVDAPSGSEIQVDGRPAGVTPLTQPIALTHGRHFVAVVKNGSLGYSTEVNLVRGETQKIGAKLVSSGQRTASYVVLATSLGALAAGGVFLGISLSKQSKAKSILDAQGSGNISNAQLDDYANFRDQRDRFRTMSYVSFGACAGLAVTGLFLYAFDRPSVTAPLPSSLEPSATPKTPPPPSMEMGAVPIIGPSVVGAAFAVAF